MPPALDVQSAFTIALAHSSIELHTRRLWMAIVGQPRGRRTWPG